MQTFLTIAQLIVSASLILVILLQSKGTGISAAFGGEGGFYRSRRGVEKLFVYFTIILTFLFLILCILQIVI